LLLAILAIRSQTVARILGAQNPGLDIRGKLCYNRGKPTNKEVEHDGN